MTEEKERPYITQVKPDLLWIKQPTRALRDEPTFPYADLYIAENGLTIGIKPRAGGDVTAGSTKVKYGKITCENLGGSIEIELLGSTPLPCQTSYNESEDMFQVHLDKPVFTAMNKADIITYIRQTAGLSGNLHFSLGKEELMNLFDCENQFEMLDEIRSLCADDTYSVSVTFNLNKEAVAKLASDLENYTDD